MEKMAVTVLSLMVYFLFVSVPNLPAGCFPTNDNGVCKGNFDYDCDVDGTDAANFKTDFGRSPFFNPCPPDGPARIGKTGQTTSYATGDDGDLEKGIVWPNPRFTDNGDGTVTDNLTGLIWLKDTNCFATKPWDEALSACNGLSSGSCSLTDSSSAGDWRLPNRFELESLLDLEYYNPALSNTAGTGQWSAGDPFEHVSFLSNYWTATSLTFIPDQAWYLDPVAGTVDLENKTTHFHVWPVRGGHSGSSTSTTTISCIQQGMGCTLSSQCCDGCCCNGQGLFVCTNLEQCGLLGGGCD